jgi:hypothetical protein
MEGKSMKAICVSCNKKKEINHSTFRNGETLPLCDECWNAALQIQHMMRVENRAEAAKQRWEWKRTNE